MKTRLIPDLHRRQSKLGCVTQQGFTLIELLIVIIIWAILGAMAWPFFLGLISQAILIPNMMEISAAVADEQYQKAEALTTNLLLDAADKTSGYITDSDLQKPKVCKALLAADRGWNSGSGGRYGFTKQHQLYRNAQPRNGWNKYQDFMIELGWADPKKGILPPDYRWTAPEGHLPYWDGSFKKPGDKNFHFFYRFEQCQKR